jgi:DNA-binding winged helix-turn-helix (wHTH) protein/TolB-like protein
MAHTLLGEHRFDQETGELWRSDGDGEPMRLPPQPARLLALLIERQGALVTREEMRAHLWPGVHSEVDVDRSINFCVRRIRAAFGDVAANPTYIETLPRRGVRLLVEPRGIAKGAGGERGTPEAHAAHRGSRKLLLACALAAVTVFTTWAVARSLLEPPSTARPSAPVRLGIMPFSPPPGRADRGGEAIADGLVARLGRDPERVGVIGPLTTGGYEATPQGLQDLAKDYRLDFLLNGRYFGDGADEVFLVELIRVSDGVHVWVERFDDLSNPAAVADIVEAAAQSAIGES